MKVKSRYKLLRDLPDLKAGAEFYYSEGHGCYVCPKRIYIGGGISHHFFTEGTMEDKEWFEEIPEAKKEFTLSDMVAFGKFIQGGDYAYEVNVRRMIPIDMLLVDKWIQKDHPEMCVGYKKK